jgi:hypothetical protein
MTPVSLTIERFLAEYGPTVPVTLADSAGSSPRKVGARTLVRLGDGRCRIIRPVSSRDCIAAPVAFAGWSAQLENLPGWQVLLRQT